MPLINRQQWHSRLFETSEFFTDLTLMYLNLILVPLLVGHSSPSKILFQLITTDYSLLFEYSLSFCIWKFNILELLTFFQTFSPAHTYFHSTQAPWWHCSWKIMSPQQKVSKREFLNYLLVSKDDTRNEIFQGFQ